MKLRIACGYGVIFLGMGAILVAHMMTNLHSRVERILVADQAALTETLALEIGEKIALQVTAVERVATLINDRLLGTSAQLNEFLANRTGILSFFAGGLAVVDGDGGILGRSDGFIAAESAAQLHALTAETFATGQAKLTEAYRQPQTAAAVCAIVVPILRADRRVSAVLIGIVQLERRNFLGRVVDYRIGTSGDVFIYAPHGRQIVVASRRREVLFPAPPALTTPMLDRFAQGDQGPEPTSGPDGAAALMSGHAIPFTPWLLISRVPLAEGLLPIAQMKTELMAAVILFAGLSLFGLWLVLAATMRPLATATAAIQAMGDGRAPLRPLADVCANEVGGLLTAFNALQARISASELELQASHQALKAREGIYYELFENSKAVEILIDPVSGMIFDANQAATTYYGWSRDQLKTMNIDQINILSQDAIAAEMRLAKLESRNQFFFRHRLCSGEIRDVEVHSGPMEINSARLLYSIVHDVTDRRRAERETIRLLSFQRALLDAAGNLIIATDPTGLITLFNPAAERWLGHQAADVVGHATPDLFHDPAEVARQRQPGANGGDTPGLSDFQALTTRALARGGPEVAEWHFVSKSGTRFPVLLSVSVIPDAEGKPGGFIAIAQDISGLKALEADLRRSNSDLERFAYVASHDLRQPLRMISGYLALLNKSLKAKLGPDEEKYIRFAVDGAKRMDQMIKDLLDYSRIGRVPPEPERVDLQLVLSRVLETLAGPIAECEAAVTLSTKLPTVPGNGLELERLFQNLIGNALKFRHAQRVATIAVRVEEAPGEWRIAVADNGIGMDPQHHDRLFNIFQRLVSREDYEGNGIGLAACRKIMEHHGGRIWVESELDVGSTFWIALPRRSGQAAGAGAVP